MHRDLPRLDKNELLAKLAQGHEARVTVVTPNRRLAESLRADFDRSRTAQGLRAWEAADILPYEAMVERMWEDALYSTLAPEIPVLLGAAQERALWQQAIAAHRPPDRLFSTEAAAAQCGQAWHLAHAWRLETQPGPFWNDDARAFLAWSAHYRRATRESGTTDRARLPDVLAPHAGHASIRRPRTLVLYGFDLWAPQMRDFLDALAAAGTTIVNAEPAAQTAEVRRVELTQSRDEILAAARWARSRLEGVAPSKNGAASPRIGIVVPDLARVRARVHRLFANVLQPDHMVADRGTALPFDISLGVALANVPLVADALRILALGGRSCGFEDASRVVRSPFVAGGETERDVRSRLDARLRRRAAAKVSLDALRRQCGAPQVPPAPLLVDGLERLAALRKEILGGRKTASDWARAFSEALQAIGFPGERVLDSTERQALEKWHDLLAEFATLERVVPKMDCEEAHALVAGMAREAIFQPEADEVPIRILGVLESAGLEFDHLWVMGLTDDAWPLPARPNPFLPVRLQRAAGVPQADPVSSLELDRRITEGWMRAAGEVVLSHARMRDESQLAPSPLIAGVSAMRIEDLAIPPARLLRDAIHESGTLEIVADAGGPPFAGAAPGGGTRLFRDQAACPFRGFAHFRLFSEPVETPRPGLDPRERGTLVHCMLASVWRAIGSRERLMALTPDALDEILRKSADEAFEQRKSRADILSGRFGALEHARLARIAREWLAIEAVRDDFEVVAIEEKQALAFGGVTVNVRLDRVDRLASGTHAVIDYKTGKCSVNQWLGPRPEEPQLPMYALGAREVGAIAFAQVRTGEMGFRGLTREAGLLPGVDAIDKDRYRKKYASWPALLQSLRAELEAIGSGFAAGDARVDPAKGAKTCAHCDQKITCRIAEKADFGVVGGEVDD